MKCTLKKLSLAVSVLSLAYAAGAQAAVAHHELKLGAEPANISGYSVPFASLAFNNYHNQGWGQGGQSTPGFINGAIIGFNEQTAQPNIAFKGMSLAGVDGAPSLDLWGVYHSNSALFDPANAKTAIAGGFWLNLDVVSLNPKTMKGEFVDGNTGQVYYFDGGNEVSGGYNLTTVYGRFAHHYTAFLNSAGTQLVITARDGKTCTFTFPANAKTNNEFAQGELAQIKYPALKSGGGTYNFVYGTNVDDNPTLTITNAATTKSLLITWTNSAVMISRSSSILGSAGMQTQTWNISNNQVTSISESGLPSINLSYTSGSLTGITAPEGETYTLGYTTEPFNEAGTTGGAHTDTFSVLDSIQRSNTNNVVVPAATVTSTQTISPAAFEASDNSAGVLTPATPKAIAGGNFTGNGLVDMSQPHPNGNYPALYPTVGFVNALSATNQGSNYIYYTTDIITNSAVPGSRTIVITRFDRYGRELEKTTVIQRNYVTVSTNTTYSSYVPTINQDHVSHTTGETGHYVPVNFHHVLPYVTSYLPVWGVPGQGAFNMNEANLAASSTLYTPRGTITGLAYGSMSTAWTFTSIHKDEGLLRQFQDGTVELSTNGVPTGYKMNPAIDYSYSSNSYAGLPVAIPNQVKIETWQGTSETSATITNLGQAGGSIDYGPSSTTQSFKAISANGEHAGSAAAGIYMPSADVGIMTQLSSSTNVVGVNGNSITDTLGQTSAQPSVDHILLNGGVLPAPTTQALPVLTTTSSKITMASGANGHNEVTTVSTGGGNDQTSMTLETNQTTGLSTYVSYPYKTTATGSTLYLVEAMAYHANALPSAVTEYLGASDDTGTDAAYTSIMTPNYTWGSGDSSIEESQSPTGYETKQYMDAAGNAVKMQSNAANGDLTTQSTATFNAYGQETQTSQKLSPTATANTQVAYNLPYGPMQVTAANGAVTTTQTFPVAAWNNPAAKHPSNAHHDVSFTASWAVPAGATADPDNAPVGTTYAPITITVTDNLTGNVLATYEYSYSDFWTACSSGQNLDVTAPNISSLLNDTNTPPIQVTIAHYNKFGQVEKVWSTNPNTKKGSAAYHVIVMGYYPLQNVTVTQNGDKSRAIRYYNAFNVMGDSICTAESNSTMDPCSVNPNSLPSSLGSYMLGNAKTFTSAGQLQNVISGAGHTNLVMNYLSEGGLPKSWVTRLATIAPTYNSQAEVTGRTISNVASGAGLNYGPNATAKAMGWTNGLPSSSSTTTTEPGLDSTTVAKAMKYTQGGLLKSEQQTDSGTLSGMPSSVVSSKIANTYNQYTNNLSQQVISEKANGQNAHMSIYTTTTNTIATSGNGIGQLQSTTTKNSSNGIVTGVTYSHNGYGQVETVRYSDGHTVTYVTDPRTGWLQSKTVTGADGTTTYEASYTAYPNGMRKTEAVTLPDGGYTITYSYAGGTNGQGREVTVTYTGTTSLFPKKNHMAITQEVKNYSALTGELTSIVYTLSGGDTVTTTYNYTDAAHPSRLVGTTTTVGADSTETAPAVYHNGILVAADDMCYLRNALGQINMTVPAPDKAVNGVYPVGHPYGGCSAITTVSASTNVFEPGGITYFGGNDAGEQVVANFVGGISAQNGNQAVAMAGGFQTNQAGTTGFQYPVSAAGSDDVMGLQAQSASKLTQEQVYNALKIPTILATNGPSNKFSVLKPWYVAGGAVRVHNTGDIAPSGIVVQPKTQLAVGGVA